MDSKTLNEGVPSWLLAHKQVGSRAWKQKKNQLLWSEGGLGFALVFSKGSMRSVEPWQRVGVLLDITLDVTYPALSKLLGLSEKSVIVSVQIQPRIGAQSQRWQTSEETVDALAAQVGARLSGILDELVRVLAHPTGFESLVAQAYDRMMQATRRSEPSARRPCPGGTQGLLLPPLRQPSPGPLPRSGALASSRLPRCRGTGHNRGARAPGLRWLEDVRGLACVARGDRASACGEGRAHHTPSSRLGFRSA